MWGIIVVLINAYLCYKTAHLLIWCTEFWIFFWIFFPNNKCCRYVIDIVEYNFELRMIPQNALYVDLMCRIIKYFGYYLVPKLRTIKIYIYILKGVQNMYNKNKKISWEIKKLKISHLILSYCTIPVWYSYNLRNPQPHITWQSNVILNLSYYISLNDLHLCGQKLASEVLGSVIH